MNKLYVLFTSLFLCNVAVAGEIAMCGTSSNSIDVNIKMYCKMSNASTGKDKTLSEMSKSGWKLVSTHTQILNSKTVNYYYMFEK